MSNQKRRKDVRNIAIIAHVDHGKTTLVDALLKYTGAYDFKEGEATIMDSNPLERERGITILSKNASLQYKGVQLNIVDTPGHADFGSEVERILQMVDGVLLLVDAFEGPMPQTKFVLKKSLELHLKPILVINKLDRPHARPHEVADMTFDLFCELNATDEQLDFPIVYASGKDGYATLDLDEPQESVKPLLETILHRVLPPIADPDMPFQMLITMLDYDSYVGIMAIGRIFHGTIRTGDPVALMKRNGTIARGKATKIMKYRGLKKVECMDATAGDIISISGIEDIQVGETLACIDNPKGLPTVKIDEPTISMNFSHNTSPIAGRDGGRFLTSRHIRERLNHEAMINVGIKVDEVQGGERFKVSGRGELHLEILIETMRREGYEMEVSRPQVILKKMGEQTLEPVEEVVVEVDREYQGAVMQALGARKAEVKSLAPTSSAATKMEFVIATRALIGFRSDFLVMTRGTGVMYQNFLEYQIYKGEMPGRQTGVMVSQSSGKAIAFALFNLQPRGEILVRPGDDLYEGMIVGVNNKGRDLVVNAMKGKKLTNMRASGSDDAIQLIPPREMTLEFALEFIEEDELVEITPKNIRMRKFYLNENDRKRASR
ncbi:MAG: translational GTPase TypA [Candidatus Omnitrophica bacterium]|nr:translational GTPase TypA [Candidatus Omnitrophota bacterium]MBU1128284.1 translational GTPase TypA [Candidatus Omnitrophota bacterium]MBU1656679.1 translational GTPase TypA [Candidatus Omnitrophota bacterium]MBU1784039.1 translational GTPase TypA [Candidatus Omnitrophota bacterium]MBU1851034.1 translational GTPase TypA [Candidatus Omnitrophota bacterium]